VIERVARRTAVCCAAIAIVFATWRQSIAAGLGVIGGGVLIGMSFWAIRSGVDDLLLRFRGETAPKTTAFTLVKFFTRHAIVALAAYGMMVRLHLDPVGLLMGVSSLGVAVAVEVLRDLRWRRFP
jgi:hypothetical protein